MPDNPARIVLTMRITQATSYAEPRDSISHDWIALARRWQATPLLLPNGLDDPAGYLSMLSADLLVLTGGDDPGQDTARDLTEKALLDEAVRRGTPVLGVCRGLQAINMYFGGDLGAVAGHVAVSHAVKMNGAFTSLYGAQATVNSYHAQTVPAGRLAPGLVAAATDELGNVEALYHCALPIAAVMWHPERDGAPAADRDLAERLIMKGAI